MKSIIKNHFFTMMYVLVAIIAFSSIKSQQTYTPKFSQIVEIYSIDLTDTFVMSVMPKEKKKMIRSYKDLTMPEGIGKPVYFQALFKEVSKITGVEVRILMKFAAIESSFNPLAGATTSRAEGLFQFTPATWSDVVKKYGKAFNINQNTSRKDPRANALMAGFHIQSNIKLLSEKTNKKVIHPQDIYLTHLLGRTGSLNFFKLHSGTVMAERMPREARSNKRIFYHNGKPRTQGEVYSFISQHIRNKVKEFDIVT